MPESLPNDSPLAALRQFARKRSNNERCELCSQDVSPGHEHLVDIETRRLVCACQACAILFSNQTSAKFRRVPRRILWLSDFQMTDAQWDNLMIPVDVAFMFRSSGTAKTLAFYPSPAGAIESSLSLETWQDLQSSTQALREMEPDVEALLVNRAGAQRGVVPRSFIVPIDECYRLVGLIRMHWRGLSGGTEVWRQVGAFFDELRTRAEAPGEGQKCPS